MVTKVYGMCSLKIRASSEGYKSKSEQKHTGSFMAMRFYQTIFAATVEVLRLTHT